MLITPIDLLFVLVGLLIMAVGFLRRRTVPAPEPAPPASPLELFLTGLSLIPAAVGPNVLVVALTPGMPGMPLLVRWALLPSLLLLVLVWAVAARLGLRRLTNRIWTGIWVGFSCTAALDVLRLISFSLGFLPGNLPRMFGVLILDTMALGPTPLSDLVGALYHYWVSAGFGLTYTLLCGRTRWWGGLLWGLIIDQRSPDFKRPSGAGPGGRTGKERVTRWIPSRPRRRWWRRPEHNSTPISFAGPGRCSSWGCLLTR